MTSSHANLLAAAQLGSISLRNRVVFGAHTTNLADNGLPGRRMTDYYLERGRGGAAMIVTEPMPVSVETRYSQMNLRPIHEAPDVWRRFVREIRATGAALVQQLIHLGVHVDSTLCERAALGAESSPSWVASQGAVAADQAALDRVAAAFVNSAVEARTVGFDGVELFANYQGLIEQIWTAAFRRSADLADICRFSALVCRGIRQCCGRDFVIGMAVSAIDGQPGILPPEDMVKIVAWHDRQGLIDYVSCGSGGYRKSSSIVPSALEAREPPGHRLAAALCHQNLHALVQQEAALHTASDASEALYSGADLVSLVRPMICEPKWVSHVEHDTAERIRPCTACNQACIGRRSRDLWVSCVSNPRAGREHLLSVPGGDGPGCSRALIVGGGPAGMEAARVLGARGWRVRLVEASAALGGKMRLMAMLPGLERYARLLNWYENELRLGGVEIALNCRLTPTEAQQEAVASGASVLILSTGAPSAPAPYQRASAIPIDISKGAGIPIEELMLVPPARGTRVLLVDDLHDHRGLTAACHLQEKGLQMEIITSAMVVGGGLAGAGLQSPLRRRFVAAGGRMRCETILLEWQRGRARLRDTLNQQDVSVSADLISWACPSEPDADQGTMGVDEFPGLIRIGDAAGARNAEAAILEAHRISLAL